MSVKFLIAYVLALSTVCFARPAEEIDLYHHLAGRALSPDNTCGNLFNGNNKNYTCDPKATNGGGCCSQYGYCGRCPLVSATDQWMQ